MQEFEYNLGATVRDTITGFSGIIVGRSQWLTGCNTYGVKPKELKDGIPQDCVWLDEHQLEAVIEAKNVVLKDVKNRGRPPRFVKTPNR